MLNALIEVIVIRVVGMFVEANSAAEDAGLYICVATNNVSRRTQEILVNIKCMYKLLYARMVADTAAPGVHYIAHTLINRLKLYGGTNRAD